MTLDTPKLYPLHFFYPFALKYASWMHALAQDNWKDNADMCMLKQ